MATYSIDTAAAIKHLKQNGFEEQQAEAIVHTFGRTQDDLVSKHDLDAAVNAITKEMNEKFSEVHLEFAKIDTKFAKLQFWGITCFVIAVGGIKALDYLLPLIFGGTGSG